MRLWGIRLSGGFCQLRAGLNRGSYEVGVVKQESKRGGIPVTRRDTVIGKRWRQRRGLRVGPGPFQQWGRMQQGAAV